jgi:Xaa-Pro aminopeptidase
VDDNAELKLRLQKIWAQAEEKNFDALLVYSSPLKSYFVHYVSNYTLIGEGALVAITPDREPVLWITEEWDLDRAREESWLGELLPSKNLVNSAAEFLGQAHRNIGVIGLEWGTVGFAEEFHRVFGGRLVEATEVLDKAAITKTPLELNNIRRAAQMADIGFLQAFEICREGLREYELGAELTFALRREGAADTFNLLYSGTKCASMVLPRDKELHVGDLVLFEITPVNYIRTYSAQLIRTIILGEPPDEVASKYEILTQAMEHSLTFVNPGALSSDIARAQNEVVAAHGYKEYCRPPYMRSRGHGFGLGRFELVEGLDIRLEAGMSFVVHTEQFFPDVGYLALGDMVIVTENGCERLPKIEPRIVVKELG